MKLSKRNFRFLTTLVVLSALGISGAVAAEPAAMAEVKESGKIYHRLTAGDNEIRLLADTPYSETVKNFVFGDYSDKVGFAAESLYYVKKSTLVEKSKKEDKSNIDTSINAVSKIVRSVSKMKGMEYYSNTRKKWEVLYTDAYRVESADSTAAISDDLTGSSDGKTSYALLDEHTLGKSVYKTSYHENAKMVVMEMKNVTPMNYGIIKLIEPEKCKIAVALIDDGDGYFVYIGMQSDFMQMAAFEKKINASFQARLDAIFNWITLQF